MGDASDRVSMMAHMLRLTKRAITWLDDVELHVEEEYLPSMTRNDRQQGRGT